MAFEEELNKRRAQREKLRQQRLAQQKKTVWGLIAAALVLIGCAVLIFVAAGNKNPSVEPPPQDTHVEDTQPQTTQPQTVTKKETVIRLSAAGDLNVTDKTVASGDMGGSYDFTKAFMDVTPLLTESDLTVLNFEGSLCGAPYGDGNLGSAPIELMQALRNSGVDLVQVANSCSINHGLLGLSETLTSIRSAGLEPLGAYANTQQFQESGGYTMVEVQGIKIAFVAFTKGMNNRGLPSGSEDCVNLLYTDYASTYQKVDTEGITQILENVEKAEPDITVAMLHWGSEYNDKISSSQEEIRSLMLKQGVDVIIGTHSHFVQKMVHDTENNTFTAYSLGDFFGNAQRAGSNYSVVLNLEITKNHETGITTITNYSYDPIFTQTRADGKLQVVRIADAIAAYESDHIQKISQADYASMSYALGRIDARIKGE